MHRFAALLILVAATLGASAQQTPAASAPSDSMADYRARMAEIQARHDAAVAKAQAENDAIQADWKAKQAQWDAERKAQEEAAAELAKKPNAKIGMTAKQVRTATNWGEPNSVNRTTTGKHVHEQWVYGDDQYLYFDDGRLTAIQNH